MVGLSSGLLGVFGDLPVRTRLAALRDAQSALGRAGLGYAWAGDLRQGLREAEEALSTRGWLVRWFGRDHASHPVEQRFARLRFTSSSLASDAPIGRAVTVHL